VERLRRWFGFGEEEDPLEREVKEMRREAKEAERRMRSLDKLLRRRGRQKERSVLIEALPEGIFEGLDAS